jgi:asparagine synthase (glutamine-hydrolysing)
MGKLSDWVNTTREHFADDLKREHPRCSFLDDILPSQVGNARTWLAILEHLPLRQSGEVARYEYRYPFLDRDLVGFLFSVSEQLVRM